MMYRKLLLRVSFYLVNLAFIQAQSTPPPNKPAEVSAKGNEIRITYNHLVLFTGNIQSGELKNQKILVDETNGMINQVVMFQGSDLVIKGEVTASVEAFPCESDRRTSNSYDFVRHSYGSSTSLLNRAIYDRKYDWVLSVDEQGAKVKISPDSLGKFKIEIRGKEICLRFRPLFYQKHRGLGYYKPWEYQIKEKPVVGWCSWFAFWNRVTENDIHQTADVLSEKLLPYGLEYLQIDDGYQSDPIGLPPSWLISNNKFPNGMNNLAKYILNKGFKPGIWTNTSFHNRDQATQFKKWFVIDDAGFPAYGNWIGYSIDGSNPEAIDSIVRPVYSGFKSMGWNYFKVDALRHLKYEGYNSHSAYFKKRNIDINEAYRNVLAAVREEVGKDNYILACWGARPELIGLADACRIGNDGYGLGGLSQFNSFNNVVWLNDPDHIEAFEEYAYRDCMATSITGSLYMITDKPEEYAHGNIEPVIRTIPVLRTHPGQLYDVDPVRTMYLSGVNSQTSGSGERLFDAGRYSFNDLFLLEINRSFENWIILGRTGESVNRLEFERLGLDPAKEYLVFEFWEKTLLGSFSGYIEPPEINNKYKCQVLCVREKVDHPQLLASNRHITCGAVDICNMEWTDRCLKGTSVLIPRDEYVLYFYEPEGFIFKGFRSNGVKVLSNELNDGLRRIHLISTDGGKLKWSLEYN